MDLLFYARVIGWINNWHSVNDSTRYAPQENVLDGNEMDWTLIQILLLLSLATPIYLPAIKTPILSNGSHKVVIC